MDISVIVVCYNEKDNIAACLDSLLEQDYRGGEYEVIVVDGDSNDGTAEIIQGYTAVNSSVKYVSEPRRGTAVARNAGISHASFPMIAYTDADCEADRTWLRNLALAWQEAVADSERIGAVGGPAFPPEDIGLFPMAIKIGLNTYLGSGGRVTGKFHAKKKFVADLPSLNVIYPRELFEQIGYFSDDLKSEGEDAEFSYRILKAGLKLAYDPRPRVFHKYRPTPGSWWKNMLRYGRARGTLLVKYPMMLNAIYAAPALLVILLASSLLFFISGYFLIPLIYFPIIFALSFIAAFRSGSPSLTFHVFMAVCLTHIAYGVGLITRVSSTLLFSRRR
jgi:glycosyltransferase involved in cell wall biosynthesis